MRVAVVGAGYVGAEVARELATRGHEVLAVRRRPVPLPGIEALAADVTAPLSLPALEAVVYAVSPGASDDGAYERAYVVGLRHVIEAARGARVVFTSSTAVYAQDDGSVVDETSEVTARGTARHLLDGERLAIDAGGVVLRLAGIYGPGRDRLIRMVRDGTARLSSDPATGPIGNRIHQRDAAGAIVHLLGLASPAPVYVGVDDAPVPLDDVYLWLAGQLGLPAPPPGPPDARGRSSTRKRCSNALLRDSGYRFRVPTFREGYGAMIGG